MIYLILALLIIIFLISTLSKKNIYNPLSIFLIIWIVSLFSTSLRLFGIIEYSNNSLIILTIGILCFSLGIMIFDKFFKKKILTKDSNNEKEIIYFKRINTLLSIGIFMTFMLSIVVIQKVLNGVDYSAIRSLYYSYGQESLINSKKLFTLFDWTTSIILNLFTPLIVIGMFKNNIPKKTITLYFIFLFLYVFSTTGRLSILILVIDIILAIFIYNKEINKSKAKLIRKTLIIASIIIVCMTFIRSQNVENKNESVNSVYAYSSIPLPYFSKMIEYVDMNNLQTHGKATFYGPYLIVQKSFKVLFGIKFKGADDLANIVTKPQSYWIKMFDTDDYYNAFATMFYNFYLDFRLVGVIIFSFIYGTCVEYFYFKMKNNINSMKSTIVYLILMSGLIKSFVSWQFSSATVVLSFLMLGIIIKKSKGVEQT